MCQVLAGKMIQVGSEEVGTSGLEETSVQQLIQAGNDQHYVCGTLGAPPSTEAFKGIVPRDFLPPFFFIKLILLGP